MSSLTSASVDPETNVNPKIPAVFDDALEYVFKFGATTTLNTPDVLLDLKTPPERMKINNHLSQQNGMFRSTGASPLYSTFCMSFCTVELNAYGTVKPADGRC